MSTPASKLQPAGTPSTHMQMSALPCCDLLCPTTLMDLLDGARHSLIASMSEGLFAVLMALVPHAASSIL